jgi:hypothetical protein
LIGAAAGLRGGGAVLPPKRPARMKSDVNVMVYSFNEL